MLAKVLSRLKVKLPRTVLPEACREFFRRHAVPEDIIEDLASCSFAGWLEVGPLSLIPMADFLHETWGIAGCMENGYLPVAGGDTGDPVAVHVSSRRMVFVSHDKVCVKDPPPFDECIHQTPFQYDDFWLEVVSDKRFPSDFYSAQKRWAKT